MSTAAIAPVAMPTPTAHPVTYGLDPSTPRFSVARYEQMIAHGILTTDDRIELLENYLVVKMSHDPIHDGTLDLVKAAVDGQLPRGWLLRMQQAVDLADSQPEPDFTVARGHPRSFLARHPRSADIGMLIEVSNSSLLQDQRDKARIYARAGIAIYWIVNLVDQRIEVYTQPSGPAAVPAYGAFQVYQPGDVIPLVLEGNSIANLAVSDLLP